MSALQPTSPTPSGPVLHRQIAALLEDALRTYLAGRSPHTARAYQARVRQFIRWRADQPPAPFVAHLRDYIAHLQAGGMSARSVQAHVNTIKGLIKIAAALDTSGQLAQALPTLALAKPPTVRGQVQGDRLNERQRQALFDLPGTRTHKGRRDTLILMLMGWLGLRRSEVVALNWSHIDALDGHHVIRNLSGKHGRVRTVKLPPPVRRLLAIYAERAGLDTAPDAPVFVGISKWDTPIHGRRMTASAVAFLVEHYTRQIGQIGRAHV